MGPNNSPSTIEINCSNDSELDSGQELSAMELAIAVACYVYAWSLRHVNLELSYFTIFNKSICIS